MSDEGATSDHNVVVYHSSTTGDTSKVFATFVSSVIPEVTTVRLYAETIAHVVDNHPEVVGAMPGVVQAAAVERAIADPSHVEKSRGSSYVFVDTRTTNDTGEPLRVPVKVVSGTSARVATYFFASFTGDVAKVYERPDD